MVTEKNDMGSKKYTCEILTLYLTCVISTHGRGSETPHNTGEETMTNAIEKAIAQSIQQNESPLISGGLADVAALIERADDYRIEDNGQVAAWGNEDGAEWAVRVDLDYDDIATESIAAWCDDASAYPRQRITQGFLTWCWDVRDETLAMLQGEGDEQLIADLVYMVQQIGTPVRIDEARLKEAFADLVRRNRADLIEEIQATMEAA